MEGEGILLTIVDLALALIGFSSVVAALRRSRDKAWSSQEINGLVFLAIMASGAILFALLPFALFYMELTLTRIFSIAAAAYCVYSVSVMVGMAWRARRSGFPSRRPWVFNSSAALSVVVTFMMALIAVGQISTGVFGWYLVGVMWLLVLAFVQFVVFLSFVGFAEGD
jgi:hypothetical protein